MTNDEQDLQNEERRKIPRPTPDGEFIVIIILKRVGLPHSVERDLTKYLKSNVDLFSIFLNEMPDNDSIMVCHQLNTNP